MRKTAILLIFIVASVLAACAPVPPGAELTLTADGQNAAVEYSGVVEAIDIATWTIDGQDVNITNETVMDANIAVGDTVRVNAMVTADGTIAANRIEIFVSPEVQATAAASAASAASASASSASSAVSSASASSSALSSAASSVSLSAASSVSSSLSASFSVSSSAASSAQSSASESSSSEDDDDDHGDDD